MNDRRASIMTTTMETFSADVIEQSSERPVVVDFWAEWCQPCRQLMPLLEKLANEMDGAFCLIKVNVDELPEIAGAFGVQSIPFVVAMVDGNPASHFAGLKQEQELRDWLGEFLPSPAVDAWNLMLSLEAEGKLEEAEQACRKACELDSETAS
ncbi:MAG: thioredoxin family protein, partial [Planctomycetaceae bacterium]